MDSLDKLLEYQRSDNVADLLEDSQLDEIASKVINEDAIDEKSMSKWMEKVKIGMDIALQVMSSKTDPWEGCANVKYPLVANAAITFAAREYPQIVRGQKVVEASVFGKDPGEVKLRRGRRKAKYHNWQLLVDSTDWEADTDKLLTTLAIIGTIFTKQYYDSVRKKNVRELCRSDRITINNNVSSLEESRRITHHIFVYKNNIIENMRRGIFKEYDLDKIQSEGNVENNISNDDPDRPHELLEQHRFLDLDEDGYQEPYIVTVHKTTKKVLRIVSRFEIPTDDQIKVEGNKKEIIELTPINYFTDFHFLPSPDGSFLSMGFSQLLGPINESINAVINQLLDAGAVANSVPIVMGSGARIPSKTITIAPGKVNKIETGMPVKDVIYPLPISEPSSVLFQLLGMLVQVGNELGSVSEILKGNQPTQNSPATTVLKLIEQGLVTYNAIHKRVLRGFTKEFTLLDYITGKNLDIEKYLIMSEDPEASAQDFLSDDIGIKPVADPNLSSDAQKLVKAQSIYSLPEVDRVQATKFLLEAYDCDEGYILKLLPQLDPNFQPPPNPEMEKMMAEAALTKEKAKEVTLQHSANAAELQMRAEKQQKEMQKMDMEMAEMNANIRVLTATVAKLVAEAKKAMAESQHVGDKPSNE